MENSGHNVHYFSVKVSGMYVITMELFFSPGATTPNGGCILQPSSGL